MKGVGGVDDDGVVLVEIVSKGGGVFEDGAGIFVRLDGGAGASEVGGKGFAGACVRFDEEDFSAVEEAVWFGRMFGLCGEWQGEMKGGAGAGFAEDIEGSAHAFDELFGDGEAES